jgi:hypothetical protein
VTALFRYSSGTAYTRCPTETGNEGVVSGQVCARAFAGDFFGARRPSFKQLDMRFTKSFAIQGLDVTGYLDARNILNLKNILNVFTVTGDVVNREELNRQLSGDSAGFAVEAQASGVYQNDGSIDLRFGGAGAGGCGNWVTAQNNPAAPNCVYLIRAEERFGNGDHVFDVAEQRQASLAAYNAGASGATPARGLDTFTGEGRRLRVGFEINF